MTSMVIWTFTSAAVWPPIRCTATKAMRLLFQWLPGLKTMALPWPRSSSITTTMEIPICWVVTREISTISGATTGGVGRNLAYKKNLFFKTKGFVKHRHVASGDDDLMINEVSTGSNTSVVIDKESHTVSEPPQNMAGWWLQKRRHLSTGSYYRISSKLFLGVFTLTHLLFYLSFFLVLSMETMYWLVLCGISLKWIVHLSIIRVVTRTLEEDDLFLFSLLGDLFSPFFNTAVAISNRINPPIKWR